MASDTTTLPALPSDEALLASLTDLHGQQPRLKHRDDGFSLDPDPHPIPRGASRDHYGEGHNLSEMDAESGAL
jgi:hypothetical protein